ncbi:MAG: HD domain-containing protein [Bacteroidaceae bacterium]|nr:HD domain-containing protein [Bacteroidaceae bacterium]
MKIINDPVFGFIRIPEGLLLDIVNHPAFFRLTRIKQLGLASVVYPGAQHTRFQHSLGAFHLMTRATESLKRKGHFIFDSEEEAVLAAILLHDVGHGPFSHVLEHTLTEGISHEDISLMVMQRMNDEMQGLLTLAIKVFQGDYPKQFLHQLISSQLDMDRLDYLRRDSFFTGVTEGNIGSARIIDMLNVVDDHLVVEKKGIYSIENYLVTRRLMYWQVYLHKTAVAAEHVLINALRRAKWLAAQGVEIFCSPALHFFLYNKVSRSNFDESEDALNWYLALDDNDIWCALNVWQRHEDKVLALLARDFINRRIFRAEVSDEPFSEEYVRQKVEEQARHFGLSPDDARYLVALKEVGKDMYNPLDDRIEILEKDGTIHDVTEVSDMLNIDTLSKHVRKYYLCTQRY